MPPDSASPLGFHTAIRSRGIGRKLLVLIILFSSCVMLLSTTIQLLTQALTLPR
jgi:hypothetical protein